MNEKAWKERKEHFLKRLENDVKIGRVDSDIIDLLNLINSFENYYTLSSCSGRIQLIEGPSFSNRKSLKNFGKFHESIKKEDILKALEKSNGENFWASVQAPIIHIACKDLNSAYKLLKIARSIGFKHSGILAINNDRFVLELNSSFRIDFPIKVKGKLLVNFNNLDELVDLLNFYLNKSKKVLNIFKEKIIKLKE
jgi:Uncharacterized conserved protein, COG1590